MISSSPIRKMVFCLVATLLLGNCAFAARPMVLLFETSPSDATSHALAGAATRALRNYLRETQRVEATVFNRESPAVTRALLESRLTPDQVASYSTEREKIRVAEVLSFDYACGSEISTDEGRVTVKVWVAKVGGGKSDRWEATGAASSTGGTDMDSNNAMQAATSAAVHSIADRAFSSLLPVAQPAPSDGAETTAIQGDQPPQPVKPSADTYVAEAEKNLKSGNIALAIQQYTRAVDTDPTNPGLRIRLAEAYAARGMFEEAEVQLARAERHGAEAEALAAAKERLKQRRAGNDTPDTAPITVEPGAPAEPSKPIVMSRPDASLVRIVEGDKLWNEDKPDEAAESYKEAVKLNPTEWRAWERLAVVNASMSLFGESRKALEELKKVQPNPPQTTLENRYEMLRRAFDTHFLALLNHYESVGASFAAGKTSREAYYADANGLAARLESMAKFLDLLDIPAAKKPANVRRSLACGLMAQAASSLTSFLEANAKTSRDNASIFAAEARKEFQEAQKLETNVVTVSN